MASIVHTTCGSKSVSSLGTLLDTINGSTKGREELMTVPFCDGLPLRGFAWERSLVSPDSLSLFTCRVPSKDSSKV